MIEQFKSLVDENRGVSPVIGVILMVAITVILAAVIGTFVLGLGDSLEQAPQAQIQIDEGSNNGQVNISHSGGDSLQGSDVELRNTGSNTVSFSPSGGTFDVGESLAVNPDSEGTQVTLTLVHTPSDSIIVEKTLTV